MGVCPAVTQLFCGDSVGFLSCGCRAQCLTDTSYHTTEQQNFQRAGHEFKLLVLEWSLSLLVPGEVCDALVYPHILRAVMSAAIGISTGPLL